ncbi:hypothetical protein [Amycolatopsis vastitatis]|uniref:Guanylate cyclase domain-containing protein n=1 Tax=Amycolatopsis vastitatis TaxID=1905142 RepID=A0A229T1G5_9PSEU|nr:hypothetical protein [Amycolatopsis vastitatis]OXM64903.1 hypothetical protein CF165_25835 [Amycolatopsis vastitatis]
MPDPDATRPPVPRPGGRTHAQARVRTGWAPGAIGIAPLRGAGPGSVDWRGSVELDTAHCTVVVVDVEGFGRRSRTNPNRLRVRRGMYRSLERAFAAAGIPWGGCRYSDLGDGVLVLASAEVTKTLFADLLLGALADELATHNGVHPPQERFRLRLALHAGEVSYDEYGVTGSSILHAQHLVDAPQLKRALADAAAVLAVIASDWFFDEVIRHSENSGARAYRSVAVSGGEGAAGAWIRLFAAPTITRPRGLLRARRDPFA